jgi:hypothetical protein
MGFRRSDLQEAFFVEGTYGFRVWGYGTFDAIDEVLREGYFEAARGILCPGELLYVSTHPKTQTDGPGGEATGVALVTVRRCERGAA